MNEVGEAMDETYRVKPGRKIKLSDHDPEDKSQFSGGKKEAKAKLAELSQRLDELQEVLYAEHKHKILVVLQALDTGGKDGTIRAVFSGINPQGVHVASFKVPTPEELDHDYLWRIHAQVPGKGEMVIFNRSHYEDVLVVRVHNLVPEAVWRKRYAQIRDFERMLAEEGTTILKFFLNISMDEQKKRLQERLDDPKKRWKFNPGDLKERALWDDYASAYQDAINETSTKWAPWYVIPANRNWYRDLAVASIIVQALEDLKLQYPEPAEALDKIEIDAKPR
jgi:PPK2 family polyphosphate:nucleotide phosphotransferase